MEEKVAARATAKVAVRGYPDEFDGGSAGGSVASCPCFGRVQCGSVLLRCQHEVGDNEFGHVLAGEFFC